MGRPTVRFLIFMFLNLLFFAVHLSPGNQYLYESMSKRKLDAT